MAKENSPPLDEEAIRKGMEQLEEENQQKRKEHRAHLIENSKRLDELVVIEGFRVDAVLTQSRATSFTPNSEIMVGGSCRIYQGGDQTTSILQVSPYNSIPITQLVFSGFSAVRAGDNISAKLLRYIAEVIDKDPFDPSSGRTLYLDRSFQPEELAIELTIHSPDSKILRMERSTDYENAIRE